MEEAWWAVNPLSWSWDLTPKNWTIYSSVCIENRPMYTAMYRALHEERDWIFFEEESHEV